MLGTPVYMSPEQCRGAREVDPRSDIYSLGCVLFHALTGRVPFDLEGAGEIIVAHLQEQPPKVSEIAPELSATVDEIVERCLAKDPAERFQTDGRGAGRDRHRAAEADARAAARTAGEHRAR